MNAVTETLQPGTVIQDTYEITKLLGEGGMGATFAGRNLASDHDVAIKVISTVFAENKRAVDLFKREANLLRSIQHEAVVRYETTLQDKDGRLFLVMEMLEGQPLSYYIKRGARLSPEDVLKLGRRLAGGLDAIAAVGTVHRDIAPDNILVPHDDILQAKLIDFGLASNTIGTEKTILGDDFAGKFSFCAPEQLGMSDTQVSPRTDAYALGLVLLKAAGLAIPGEGEGMRAGIARRNDLEIPRDTIGQPLATVLSALLKADPEDRPSPLTPVFDRALGQIGQDTGQSEDTKIAVQTLEKGKGRAGPAIIGSVVAAVVLAGAGVAFYLQQDGFGRSGGASEQVEETITIVQSVDPITLAIEKSDSPNFDTRNSALGAFIEIGRNTDEDTEIRIQAYVHAAEMADPETFDVDRSAFEEPSPRTALRFYKDAQDLGATDVADAIRRLEN